LAHGIHLVVPGMTSTVKRTGTALPGVIEGRNEGFHGARFFQVAEHAGGKLAGVTVWVVQGSQPLLRHRGGFLSGNALEGPHGILVGRIARLGERDRNVSCHHEESVEGSGTPFAQGVHRHATHLVVDVVQCLQ